MMPDSGFSLIAFSDQAHFSPWYTSLGRGRGDPAGLSADISNSRQDAPGRLASNAFQGVANTDLTPPNRAPRDESVQTMSCLPSSPPVIPVSGGCLFAPLLFLISPFRSPGFRAIT